MSAFDEVVASVRQLVAQLDDRALSVDQRLGAASVAISLLVDVVQAQQVAAEHWRAKAAESRALGERGAR